MRLGCGCASTPRSGGCRAGWRVLVAVGELHGDLVDEAAPHVPVAVAKQEPRARVRQVELPLGARDAHVGQAALLLEVARLDRPHVWKDAVLEPDAHELLEVLEAALRLDRALSLECLGIAGLLERLREEVAPPRPALGPLAQALHHRHEAADRLDRGGGGPRARPRSRGPAPPGPPPRLCRPP